MSFLIIKGAYKKKGSGRSGGGQERFVVQYSDGISEAFPESRTTAMRRSNNRNDTPRMQQRQLKG